MGPRKMIELSKAHRSEIDANPIMRKKQLKLLLSFVAFLIPFRLTMFSLEYRRNVNLQGLNNQEPSGDVVVDVEDNIKIDKTKLDSNGLKGNSSINLNKGTQALGYGRFTEGEDYVYYAKNNYIDNSYEINAYDKTGSVVETFKTNGAVQNILDFKDHFIFLSKTDHKPQSAFTKIVEYNKNDESVKELHNDPSGINSLFSDGDNFYYGNERGLQYFNKNNKSVETIAYSNEESSIRVVGLSDELVYYIDGVSVIALNLETRDREIIENGKGRLDEFSHIDENGLSVYYGYDLGINTGIMVSPKQIDYTLKNNKGDILIPKIELETELKGLTILPVKISEIYNSKALAVFDNYLYKIDVEQEGVIPVFKIYNEMIEDIYLSKDFGQYYVFSTSGDLLDVLVVEDL